MLALAQLLAFATLFMSLASMALADAMAINCNRNPQAHCLYTPPLLGRKYQTFPVVKIETGRIISQQTEQGGGITFLLADGTSGHIQCFSEGEGSDSFHFSFGYGVSDIRHERSSDGKALIGFNDGGKEAKPGETIYSSVIGVDATLRCPA